MPYRAAVIGLGRMGSTFDDEIEWGGSIFLPYCHGPSYHAHPEVELVAGADPHDEQRAIFGRRWGLEAGHLYADYREMLAEERPDLVSVCTTARVRHRIVVDCAAAGVRAIWAEKPLALTLAEADDMVDACRRHGPPWPSTAPAAGTRSTPRPGSASRAGTWGGSCRSRPTPSAASPTTAPTPSTSSATSPAAR